MKPFRQKNIVMISVMIAVLLLTACNAAEKNSESSEVEVVSPDIEVIDQATEEEYRNKNATLTVYSDLYPGEWEDIFQEHVESYFPNYTFHFITWSGEAGIDASELVAAGETADIMIGRARHLVEDWQRVGLHTPMDEMLAKHGISLDAFEPQYFDAVTIDDTIHALPLWNDGFVTFYNKEIFERFGASLPTDGMSWEESIALANEITRNHNGKQYIGQWYSPRHFLRVNQKSLPFVDRETMEVMIESEGWHEWADTLFREPMQHQGLQEYAIEQYFGHDHFRHHDEVAMYTYQTVWLRNHLSSFGGLNDWDIVAVPTFDGDGIGVQPYGQYIALSSVSEEPDAAMQVIKYLTGEEFQSYMSKTGFLTPLKSQAVRDVYMKDNGLEDKNLEALFYNELASPHPITPFDEEVISIMHHEVLTDIVRGLGDVNSSLRKGKDMAEKMIQDELLRQQ